MKASINKSASANPAVRLNRAETPERALPLARRALAKALAGTHAKFSVNRSSRPIQLTATLPNKAYKAGVMDPKVDKIRREFPDVQISVALRLSAAEARQSIRHANEVGSSPRAHPEQVASANRLRDQIEGIETQARLDAAASKRALPAAKQALVDVLSGTNAKLRVDSSTTPIQLTARLTNKQYTNSLMGRVDAVRRAFPDVQISIEVPAGTVNQVD